MRRRSFLTGALAAAALPRSTLAQTTARASVLKYVPQADLTMLDPIGTTAYVTRHHALLVYDQLYGLDSQLKPQPQMVEGHTVEDDGKRWTFKLRDSLRFHDGEPVRGRDCVASIKRWAARDALGQALMLRVAEISAPDDKSFVIRLTKPFGALLDALAKVGPPALVILPERFANTDPFKPITEAIGSGPFKWVPGERLVGARAVYERFDGYRPREGGTPDWLSGPKVAHFDRVEWLVMPDPATASAALQSGEADWWENPPNDLLAPLERNRNVVTEQLNPLGIMGTGIFNCLHPPFDKPAVRRVVLEAMSQADFMTSVAGTDQTMWREGVGIFPPGTPMASDAGLDVITRKRDMPALREKLKQAGYNGERVVLMSASDQSSLAAIGEVGNDLLRQLGMNVDFAVSDWGTVVQRRGKKEPPAQGGWNMFHTTWIGLDVVNPAVMQPLRANGAKAWFGWPDLPDLQRLQDAWLDAPDTETQKRIAADIQKVTLEQVPFLPTGQYFSKSAYRRNVTGILKGQIVFWNARRA
ncbi:MAG: ABC transporter substrate-binding protein [Rhizobiales bacterium]|nr:ABC transporter substrate-binding protein [Hyphomicrobiales bacterium]